MNQGSEWRKGVGFRLIDFAFPLSTVLFCSSLCLPPSSLYPYKHCPQASLCPSDRSSRGESSLRNSLRVRTFRSSAFVFTFRATQYCSELFDDLEAVKRKRSRDFDLRTSETKSLSLAFHLITSNSPQALSVDSNLIRRILKRLPSLLKPLLVKLNRSPLHQTSPSLLST